VLVLSKIASILSGFGNTVHDYVTVYRWDDLFGCFIQKMAYMPGNSEHITICSIVLSIIIKFSTISYSLIIHYNLSSVVLGPTLIHLPYLLCTPGSIPGNWAACLVCIIKDSVWNMHIRQSLKKFKDCFDFSPFHQHRTVVGALDQYLEGKWSFGQNIAL